MSYGNFYANVCRLLSSINGGICHRRPSVKLPLSKVGLELSRMLCNLGIVKGLSVGQQLQRVKGHARLWDPARTSISSTTEAAGFPAMYLTLYLNWDKHAPLYSPAALAAAPPPSAAAACGSSAPAAVSHPGFSPPMGLNSPTPEAIHIISKPSAQRWFGLQELIRARSKTRPGIYLLSTHQGLITDIDAELRGLGGIVLAHIGLPMGHVVQLRGLLRQKYRQELAAAQQQHGQVVHVAGAAWDARQAAGQVVASRLAVSRAGAAAAYLDLLDAAERPRQQQAAAAEARLKQLTIQEIAWTQAAGDRQGSWSRGSPRAEGVGNRGRRKGRTRSSGLP